MPDIVLLPKIYYACDSFQKVKEDLESFKAGTLFPTDWLVESLPSGFQISH